MKHLCMLLLFCSLAMGQTEPIKWGKIANIRTGYNYMEFGLNGGLTIYHSPNKVFVRYDSSGTLVQFDTLIFVSAFIQYWDEYKTECWNDSSQITRHVGSGICFGSSTGWGDFHCDNPDHKDIKVFIHRDPTFPGFMEFLRRKTK